MRSQDSDRVAAGARILLMPHLSGHEKMISKTATNPTTFCVFLDQQNLEQRKWPWRLLGHHG